MYEPAQYRPQQDYDYDCPYEGQPGFVQPSYGRPSYAQPEYGQPMYGQSSYGQPVYDYEPSFGYAQPPIYPRAYGQFEYQSELSGPSERGNGAKMAMAAAGGLAVGAGTVFAVEHAGAIGRFAEDAVDDVGGFVGVGFRDVDHLARDIF